MIALACDHHGIALKEELKKMLEGMGLEGKEFGTYDVNSQDDYPVYGYRAAKAVADGECDRGILLCGTGMGISIAAGKVKGIRVCTCSDVYSAEMSKRHNNSNTQQQQYPDHGRPGGGHGEGEDDRPCLADRGIRGRPAPAADRYDHQD